jgi:hypothetical protein
VDRFGKLKEDRLVLDYEKRPASRAAVRVEIRDVLTGGLPGVCDRALFHTKTGAVLKHLYNAHQGASVSIYEEAA